MNAHETSDSGNAELHKATTRKCRHCIWWRLNKENEAVPCYSYGQYRQFLHERNQDNRATCRLKLSHVGPWTVSSVFLGVDHGAGLEGPPVLWETMIFPAHFFWKPLVSTWWNWPYRVARQLWWWFISTRAERACAQGHRDYQWRYTSHADCLRHHRHIVRQLRKGLTPQAVFKNV